MRAARPTCSLRRCISARPTQEDVPALHHDSDRPSSWRLSMCAFAAQMLSARRNFCKQTNQVAPTAIRRRNCAFEVAPPGRPMNESCLNTSAREWTRENKETKHSTTKYVACSVCLHWTTLDIQFVSRACCCCKHIFNSQKMHRLAARYTYVLNNR